MFLLIEFQMVSGGQTRSDLTSFPGHSPSVLRSPAYLLAVCAPGACAEGHPPNPSILWAGAAGPRSGAHDFPSPRRPGAEHVSARALALLMGVSHGLLSLCDNRGWSAPGACYYKGWRGRSKGENGNFFLPGPRGEELTGPARHGIMGHKTAESRLRSAGDGVPPRIFCDRS